jgi:Na+/H+ antiporter NhaD/arsenite permease-like protein
MYIDATVIIQAASLLAAFSALGGVIVWCVKFVERQKHQDKELAAIRKENTLICYGVLACLKGLKEQGCDGPVTTSLEKLEKHLNEAAHEGVVD